VGKPGVKKGHRYSVEFKLTAVKLSHMPGIEVQTVAQALDIHPIMLSRWRQEVRDGMLTGRPPRLDVPPRRARLMRHAGLRARVVKLYRRVPGLHGFYTSIPKGQRDRLATTPDQVWVGDITYVTIGTVWRYLAVVLDRSSRRVLGWCLGAARDARLTLAAFTHAVRHRRPRPGVIFHSDRGTEYAGPRVPRAPRGARLRPKHEPPRESTDNALHPLRQRRAATLRNRLLFTSRIRGARDMIRTLCLQNRGKIPEARVARFGG
jgi:transposase InsO family protein